MEMLCPEIETGDCLVILAVGVFLHEAHGVEGVRVPGDGEEDPKSNDPGGRWKAENGDEIIETGECLWRLMQ